ncbi:MAG: potassium transporter Kup [Candidatus Hydrogenedentes bacterium]|nr:potassium transporter Kup [Candidatus Hydrogenedentota bacterium]
MKHSNHHNHNSILPLTLGALGVVYGDIGTSPLYTIKEALGGPHGFGVSSGNVLGVLSLIFWALVIVVTIKYVLYVLRADNGGEGGILALMALVSRREGKSNLGERTVLVALGIFGAALLYGDGTITPAITVLSAVEGLEVATHLFEPYIVPIAIVILVGLFLIQRHGTARIGKLFGPFILLWFAAIGLLGARAIVSAPGVLLALNPWYALHFISEYGLHGLMILGTVFLAVTGGEALYADMGHFGRVPIQLGWIAVAMPALVLNYFGQGAVLLNQPEKISNPFYALTPDFLLYPMVVLSTLAAIIASQAIITGAFSLTRQAVMLGFLPRMRILHTSSAEIGQIYVPVINFLLMLATIGLVLGFGSSSNLAAAYGVAVTTTMLITTLLLMYVMRERWNWSPLHIACVAGPFILIDFAFWVATMTKVPHGGWFPLLAAMLIYAVMGTWRMGRKALSERFKNRTLAIDKFVESVFMHGHRPKSVDGAAVFMSGTPNVAPVVLLHNLKYNKIVHDKTVVLSIVIEERSHVPDEERVEVQELGYGFFSITAHYGFMESPHVFDILDLAAKKGVQFDRRTTGFYLGRESILIGEKSSLRRWRGQLFATMSRLAQAPTAFYGIPPNQVVELGVQIEL